MVAHLSPTSTSKSNSLCVSPLIGTRASNLKIEAPSPDLLTSFILSLDRSSVFDRHLKVL